MFTPCGWWGIKGLKEEGETDLPGGLEAWKTLQKCLCSTGSQTPGDWSGCLAQFCATLGLRGKRCKDIFKEDDDLDKDEGYNKYYKRLIACMGVACGNGGYLMGPDTGWDACSSRNKDESACADCCLICFAMCQLEAGEECWDLPTQKEIRECLGKIGFCGFDVYGCALCCATGGWPGGCDNKCQR